MTHEVFCDETHRAQDGGSVRPQPARSDSRAAVEKACVLLSAFGNEADGVLGVSELARFAGVTKSTAFRQLSILERAAMVERSGRGYRIGRRLRVLAQGICRDQHAGLVEALMPYLVELFDRTRQTTQLCVLDGVDVIYIGNIWSLRTVKAPSRSGGRFPAMRTAGGKLLVAYQAPEVQGLAVALRHPGGTSARRAQSMAELAAIRRRGIAFDFGQTQAGLACAAAAITRGSGAPVAAISVCAPRATNLFTVAGDVDQVAHSASMFLRRHSTAKQQVASPR